MKHPIKYVLVVDFDGTLTPYKNGWQGIDIINEEPVPGAMEFIYKSLKFFNINIFSARSCEPKGIRAMQEWLRPNLEAYLTAYQPLLSQEECDSLFLAIGWPVTKPAAFVTIDDRALSFNGDWSIF